LGNDIEY